VLGVPISVRVPARLQIEVWRVTLPFEDQHHLFELLEVQDGGESVEHVFVNHFLGVVLLSFEELLD